MEDKAKVLTALIEEPTRYTIDILDYSMLPEKMKGKKTLDFLFKPPTIQTLSQCALSIEKLPKELLKPEKQLTLQEVLPYSDVIVDILCVLSYAKKEAFPDWYAPFIKQNCTPKEIYHIFQEVSMKMQSDFFLSCFQVAKLTNPMMMNKPKMKKKSQKGLTLTN